MGARLVSREQESHCLLNQGFWPNERVEIWGNEVDVVARRDDSLPFEPDRAVEPLPSRLVVSCVDWFNKEGIHPARMWRLIALAYTVRAEPMLVHNNRATLTSTAQEIAERWRVRVVTDIDLEEGTVIPAPETAEWPWNPRWPSPLERDVDWREMDEPEYYRMGNH